MSARVSLVGSGTIGPLGIGRHYGPIADRIESGETLIVLGFEIRDFVLDSDGHFTIATDGSISPAVIDTKRETREMMMYNRSIYPTMIQNAEV